MDDITFHPTEIPRNSHVYPHDPYIDQFWLPLLGPTATHLLNKLIILSCVHRNTFRLDTRTLALSLGTGHRSGRSSPVRKQLSRLCARGFITCFSDDEYLVPTVIPRLNDRDLDVLTPSQRESHELWCTSIDANPLLKQKRNALLMTYHLEAQGYRSHVIADTLLRNGIHPSVVGQLFTK